MGNLETIVYTKSLKIDKINSNWRTSDKDIKDLDDFEFSRNFCSRLKLGFKDSALTKNTQETSDVQGLIFCAI